MEENGTPAIMPDKLSADDLAKLLRQNGHEGTNDAVESWLRRYRIKYPDCFDMIGSPRRNEAKILYRTSDVWPHLVRQYLKTTDERRTN